MIGNFNGRRSVGLTGATKAKDARHAARHINGKLEGNRTMKVFMQAELQARRPHSRPSATVRRKFHSPSEKARAGVDRTLPGATHLHAGGRVGQDIALLN